MIAAIGKHKIELGSWNKLTFSQVLAFCRLSGVDSDPVSLKTKLLCIFFKLKPLKKKPVGYKSTYLYWFLCGWKHILISLNDINTLSESILNTFYSKDDTGNYILDVYLSKNIIPVFRVGFRKYSGPADGLTNITFREFIYADTFYVDYITTKSPDALNKLISVLFRPKKRFLYIKKGLLSYNGDTRTRFNDYLIDKQAKSINRIDPAIKTAILYYYIGCRKFIGTQFPEVFTSGGDESAETPDTFKMYMRVTDLLAKGNPLDKEKIRDQQLYDVLDSLNNLILNAPKK